MSWSPLPTVESSRLQEEKHHFLHMWINCVLFDAIKNIVVAIMRNVWGMHKKPLFVLSENSSLSLWCPSSLATGHSGWPGSCLKCIPHPCSWHSEPGLPGVSPGYAHFQQASYRIFICIQVWNCAFMERGISTACKLCHDLPCDFRCFTWSKHDILSYLAKQQWMSCEN